MAKATKKSTPTAKAAPKVEEIPTMLHTPGQRAAAERGAKDTVPHYDLPLDPNRQPQQRRLTPGEPR